MSEDAVERLVTKYVAIARKRCPSLEGKRVTPPHIAAHGSDEVVTERSGP